MTEASFEKRLQAARRLVAAYEEANPASAGHHLDQTAAATADAHRAVLHLGKVMAARQPERGWQTYTQEEHGRIPPEIAARCLVVLTELERCRHLLNSGPQPAWARLALGRVDCARCMATVRLPPADEADRCDWCGSRGNVIFSAVAIQSGPVLLFGDACGPCGTALRWFEEKAS